MSRFKDFARVTSPRVCFNGRRLVSNFWSRDQKQETKKERVTTARSADAKVDKTRRDYKYITSNSRSPFSF